MHRNSDGVPIVVCGIVRAGQRRVDWDRAVRSRARSANTVPCAAGRRCIAPGRAAAAGLPQLIGDLGSIAGAA